MGYSSVRMRTIPTRRMRALTARVFLGFARGGAAQRRCVMVIVRFDQIVLLEMEDRK